MSGERRPKPLLTVAEAADLLGRSRSATYELARRGELPGAVQLNNRYHVKRGVLLAWLASDAADRGRDGWLAAEVDRRSAATP